MNFEFNHREIPAETITGITQAIEQNEIFGLQSKKGKIIVFIPKYNAVIYPTSAISLAETKQVCENRKAFEAVIGMSLYSYKTFVLQIPAIQFQRIKALLLV